MTQLDSDMANILESLGKRLYDVEQLVTSSDVMGQDNTFEEIILDDGTGTPLPISVLGPDDVTDVLVVPDAFFDNVFADVSWNEALTGYDAGSYVVRLFRNEGLGVRTFITQATTAGTNYRFNNLEPNTEYSVTVTPYSRIGVPGDASAFSDFVTGQDTTIPPQVLNVNVGRGATSVVVSFDPLDEEEAADVFAGNGIYEVEISTITTFAERSYLALSGSGISEPSVVTTPSTTSLNQQNDVEHEFLEIVVREWAFFQGLAAKGEYTDWSFAIGLLDKKPIMYMSPDGVATFSGTATVDLPYGIGEPFDLKVTRERLGSVKFYHRPAGVGAYVQLGADVAAMFGQLINVANGTLLRVGSYISGDFAFGGSIGKYVFRNGVGGAEVANPDFRIQNPGVIAFADTIPRNWTITSKAAIESGYRNTFTNDQVVAFNDVEGDTAWYARVRAIDASGNVGSWSDVAGPSIAGGVTDKMIVADLSAAKIKTGFLSASRIATESLEANKIKTSSLSAAAITIEGDGSLLAGFGGTGDGVILNAQGLFLYKDTVAVVSLDALTGNASFKGTVTASTIVGSSITGGTINGGTITGALIQSTGGGLKISGDDITLDTGGSLRIGPPASGEAYSTILRQIGTATYFDNFSAGGMTLRTLVNQPIYIQSGGGGYIALSGPALPGDVYLSGGLIYANGDLDVQGSIQGNSLSISGAKAFKIPHPSPVKDGLDLVHASLEGPENGVFYRGRGKTNKKKSAVVTLPDYFCDLVRPDDITVHVTPVLGSEKKLCTIAASDVVDGKFNVLAGDECEFTWIVLGVRGDIPRLEIETPTTSRS